MSSTLDMLIELAGPFGPLGTQGRKDLLREALKEGDVGEAAMKLFDALAVEATLPPSVRREDLEGAAAELLAELAEEPMARLEIERALSDARLRRVAIDALGLFAHPSSGPALARLADSAPLVPLTSDELIRLVSALGLTGGDAARAAVESLRTQALPNDVAREIEIALDTMGRR